MVELTSNVSQPHHHIKLSSGFFKDLQTWKTFISHWNGAAFFLSTSWVDSPSLELYTDASGTLGLGGICGQRWFQGCCQTHQQLDQPGISIAWQELFAIVVACHLWGDAFANKRIMFFCDNESVVHIVNSKRSRIPRIMDLVRLLTLLTLEHNFYLKTVHIEGKKNEIADSLSRFQMERFWSLAPHANSVPSTIHTPGDLKNEISYYLGLSIAASTKQTYSSAEKRFLEFCLLYRPPFVKFMPVDENTLVQYAAYLARSIKYSSIKS